MRKNYITICLATALSFACLPLVFAQATEPVQLPVQQGNGEYSLKSSVFKTSAPSPSQVAASYELSGTSISGSTIATQTILTTPVNPNAAAIKTESGLYLYPTAVLGYGYNSNVASASVNAVGSSFTNFAPQVVGEFKNRGDRYTALALVNSTNYAGSSTDNFTNSEFNVAGDNYFNSRARAGWSIGQVNGSDPRSSNLRTSVYKWHTTNLNARMIYGAPEASGRFEVDLGNQVKTYDNIASDRLDLTLNTVAGRFFYRLGTRSLALLEVRNANANYASGLSSANSNTERRYYAGLTWEATAATTGIIKVGRMTKDFDQPGTESHNGNSWETTVRWLPLTYSAIDFIASKSMADSTGVGSFLLKTSNSIIWNHKWTRSLSSRVSAASLTTEYSGAGRTDTANNYGLGLDYAVLRWLRVGADLATTDNSSTDPLGAFKRNIIMFTLNASL